MIDGLVVIDKPGGWTSHDVVARSRRIFGQRRVGHSGTLDPAATGVLLVGLGRATRLLRFLTALGKSYEGELVLGVATSSLDDQGVETGRWDMSGVSVSDVRSAAAGLVGQILQIPPMVSAVKVGGQRLHALARQGVEIEREPRLVTVERFDIAGPVTPGVFPFTVTCSSGTYVRSLAADLGSALGGGAHLRNLRRTAVGSFGLADASSLDVLEQAGRAAVLPPATAMRDYRHVEVRGDVAGLVQHGRPLDRSLVGDAGRAGPLVVVDESGQLLAVYESDGEVLRAAVVLAAG